MSAEIKLIKEMIEDWREEFISIKEDLVVKGSEANSLEYNILATEALRLSLCISDATSLLLEITEVNISQSKEKQLEDVMKRKGLIS